MERTTVAQAIIAGPISDTGQLTLALVISALAGPDGWVVNIQKDLAKATRTKCRKTTKRRIQAMVKMGYMEEREKPISGVRLTEKALSWERAPCPVERAPCPTERAPYPVEQTGHHALSTGHHASQSGHLTRSPNPSAYLPKRYKDLKEKEKEKEKDPPSSSTGQLELVATNEAPKTPRRNQPAAQPPAVVEQADLLPVPAKAKPKRKTPRKKPKMRITDDWQPLLETVEKLEAMAGIPRAFTEACVWEFITYWRGVGEARAGWDATFIGSVKYSWNKEKNREQNAKKRETYCDASGKPLSEADYLSAQNAKRVLADMQAGVLDDFDLDTPV